MQISEQEVVKAVKVCNGKRAIEAVDKQIVELSKKITTDIECEAFLLKYIHGYSLRERSRTMHYDRRYICRLLAQARKEVEG